MSGNKGNLLSPKDIIFTNINSFRKFDFNLFIFSSGDLKSIELYKLIL
jgi:hypothetical protein